MHGPAKSISSGLLMSCMLRILLTIFICVTLFAGCQQKEDVSPSGKTIKVGIIGPMASPTGDKGTKGIKTAQLIEPYTALGDRIELFVFDDKSTPSETRNLYRELAKNEEFKSVLMLSTSRSMLRVSRIADYHKLPVIGTIATHPDVTRNSQYMGRVCFSDDRQGKVAAIYARDELLINRVAIVYNDQDVYSNNLKDIFRTTFRAVGGHVVAVWPARELKNNLIAELRELKELDVQLLYLVPNANEVIEILKALEQIDWHVKKMGDSGLLSVVSSRLKRHLHLLDGVLATDFISTNMNLTQLGEKGRDIYLEHFGTPDSYTVLGFEAYFLLKQALDQCVPDYSRDCVAAKIRNVKSFTGVFGKYAIKDGDSLRPVIVNEIQDGRLSLLVKVY